MRFEFASLVSFDLCRSEPAYTAKRPPLLWGCSPLGRTLPPATWTS